jgi:hypothetical protein
LKGTLKATNKGYWLYCQDGNYYQDDDARQARLNELYPNKEQNAKQRQELLDKWKRNNDRRREADEMMVGGSVLGNELKTGVSWLHAGLKFYQSLTANRDGWYGNCGEQACLALWLAFSSPNNMAADDLYIATWEHKTGYFWRQHIFCHQALVLRAANGDAYCDPWLHIACEKGDYRDQVRRKLDDWTGKGKRFLVEGFGWAEPKNDKVMQFCDAEPRLSPCLDEPEWGR